MPYSDKERQRQYGREYHKIQYVTNKAIYKARRAVQRERYRAMVRKLREKPCHDCGLSFPWYVMEFDHREPMQKRYDIPRLVGMASLKKLLTEIEKCDVVCANCHCIRTYNRRKRIPILAEEQS